MLDVDNSEQGSQFKPRTLEKIKAWKKRAQESVKLKEIKKDLNIYLKAEALLKKTALILPIGILAELAAIFTIHFKGVQLGMMQQQQSLYFKIAGAALIITAIALLAVLISIVGVKHLLDHSRDCTIENPNISSIENGAKKLD